ncbi:MAG: 50S ribosomal protein L4 [Candidatus Jacksonbacteria bacterium]|nr:50S ribosomal protein L4 [Candidatus Jacksonbacteria bacterium]
MTLPIYNENGEKTGEMDVNPKIFDVKLKTWVISEAVLAKLSNTRENIAHTKDRGEVRGGGKKPWKQKGTGRARHGSIRSPLWKGGGVTFGPKNTVNFAKKINKKVKRQALLMALSERARDHSITVLTAVSEIEREGKTKKISTLLKQLNIDAKKHVLISLDTKNLSVMRAARNLPAVKLIAPGSLNAHDVLWGDSLLTTVEGIRAIEKTYATA